MTKTTIGYFLLLIDFVTATFLLLRDDIDPTKLAIVSGIGFLVGLVFIFGDNITYIKTAFGEIRTASQKARDDAKKIENILTEVESQKERIDVLTQDAQEMKQLISEIASEAQEAKISVDAFLMAYRNVEARKRLNKSMGRD